MNKKKITYHRCRILFPVILVIFSTQSVFSQTDSTSLDSLNNQLFLDDSKARVEYFTGDDKFEFRLQDTTLNTFQKFNPARRQLFEYTYLGNFGAPYQPRFYEYNRTIGFDYGRHERDLYLTDVAELEYYRTNIPYTDLSYHIGTNSEQFLHAVHTRNIGANSNVAGGIDKLASEGYYQHMLNNYVNVFVDGWWKTKNDAYKITVGGIYSENKNQENGGIIADTVFELPFPNLAEPFLTYAFTEWSNWQGEISQTYTLSRQISYQQNDTTTAFYLKPLLEFQHTFGAHTYRYLFEDLQNDALYGDVFQSGDTMRDISKVNGFYNRLSVGNDFNRVFSGQDTILRNRFTWQLSALQQYHIISDQGGIDTVQNLIGGGHLGYIGLFDQFLFTAHADLKYDLLQDAYDAQIQFVLDREESQLDFEIRALQTNPTFTEDRYTGFNIRWDQNFEAIQMMQGRAGYTNHRWRLKVEAAYSIMDDLIAFVAIPDSGFAYNMPIQFNETYGLFQVVLEKNFRFGNIYLDNRVAYQQLIKNDLSTTSDPIKVPQWITQHSFYFQDYLFQKSLFTKFGFDVYYVADYSGDTYNPINGQFTLQSFTTNNEQQILTFEPVIDLFASFDIRTFRFFIKCDYINQGLFSHGFFVAPHYPVQPRGVKFGVNWKLFY